MASWIFPSLAANAWVRHFLGCFQYNRSDGLYEVHREADRVSFFSELKLPALKQDLSLVHDNDFFSLFSYLAAAQCFHDTTEVLMLTTNLIRKDLNRWAYYSGLNWWIALFQNQCYFSSNMYDSGVALGGLSCFVTPDLARDLASDIVNLVITFSYLCYRAIWIVLANISFQLSSSRPYTRKRAVLLLYKIFLKYPEALRPTFPRLKDKLEDPDPGIPKANHFFSFLNFFFCVLCSSRPPFFRIVCLAFVLLATMLFPIPTLERDKSCFTTIDFLMFCLKTVSASVSQDSHREME